LHMETALIAVRGPSVSMLQAVLWTACAASRPGSALEPGEPGWPGARQRLAERLAATSLLDRSVDANWAAPRLDAACRIGFVKSDDEEQAAALGAEDGAVLGPEPPHPPRPPPTGRVSEDSAVVGGAVEGPPVLLDLEAGGADRNRKPCDARCRCPG